jgi:hypothetical protein
LSQPPESTASFQQLDWLLNAVSRISSVRRASLETDASGRAYLRIELSGSPEQAQVTTPAVSPGLDSMLRADLAPMLVFDLETLEVVDANPSARSLLQFDDTVQNGTLSLADLFAQTELERLGATLVGLPSAWVEIGTWSMRGSTMASPQAVQTWCGPADTTERRLLVATPAGNR